MKKNLLKSSLTLIFASLLMSGVSFAGILGTNSIELNARASAIIEQLQLKYPSLNVTNNLKSQVLFGLEHPAICGCDAGQPHVPGQILNGWGCVACK